MTVEPKAKAPTKAEKDPPTRRPEQQPDRSYSYSYNPWHPWDWHKEANK